MVTDIYNKDVADMDEAEKEAISLAKQALVNGDKLYGDNVSHIEFALGIALNALNEQYVDSPIHVYLEIGKDESGNWVAFMLLDETDEKPA